MVEGQNLSSEVTFAKGAGGESAAVGQYVTDGSGAGTRLSGGRVYNQVSHLIFAFKQWYHACMQQFGISAQHTVALLNGPANIQLHAAIHAAFAKLMPSCCLFAEIVRLLLLFCLQPLQQGDCDPAIGGLP